MTRRLRPPPPPLDFPEPDKPLAEMTSAERDAYARKLRRALRDNEVRSGTRRPNTMREMEIWREGEADREKWRVEMIAEAERQEEERAARGERRRARGDP